MQSAARDLLSSAFTDYTANAHLNGGSSVTVNRQKARPGSAIRANAQLELRDFPFRTSLRY